ncbi:MAG: hypothetical protein QM729_09585 [Solirubrobacterales bacterium]
MAGTRGGLGRIVAMALALTVMAALAVVDAARAGTYRVAQCGWGVGADLDSTYPATEGSGFSVTAASCLAPPGEIPVGMRFEGVVAPDGTQGLARARWAAPAGTTITHAHLTWAGWEQQGNWQALMADVGGGFRLLAHAAGVTEAAAVDLPIEDGAWAFEAFLQCLFGGPVVNCDRSTASTMRMRNLTFTLEDPRQPLARLGGPLVASGWRRGTVALELAAEDAGAGVAAEAATIDGAPVLTAAPACAAQTIEGEVRGTRMQPCPPTATRSVDVDTSRLADGVHTVSGCATDFAGGQGCAPDAEVDIDNSPPAIAFADTDQGTIAAGVSDRYSGPVSGTISVRRADAAAWTDLPTALDGDGGGEATLTARLPDLGAGTYLFRAVAADAAGNTASTQLRVSGSAAEVRKQAAAGEGGAGTGGRSSGGRPTRLFVRLAPRGRGGRQSARATDALAGLAGPPSARVAADRRSPRPGGSALTVDYGTAAEVVGRLADRGGGGIAGRPLTVLVRMAPGGGPAPRPRRVVTGRGGRFALPLPPGASRHVTVAFHGGGGLAAAPRRSLALRVRAGVRLVAEPTDLRTGESVRLRGRVRLGPARVSRRGKLIAIQYLERATGRWRPALVVRTDAKGRFATSYRFRYVTGEARIRLRANAPAEGGWPFARGSSPPVTVTVHGR